MFFFDRLVEKAQAMTWHKTQSHVCEKISTDNEAIEELSPEQIYNTDGIGLYWHVTEDFSCHT